MKTRYITTLVYAFKDDCVLLLKRRKKPNLGLYSPPGGKVEDFESPRQNAVRELHEETGIIARIEDTEIIGITTEIGYENENWLMFHVKVNIHKGEINTDNKEGFVRWVPLDELPTLPMPKTDKELFWPRILNKTTFNLFIKCTSPTKYTWKEE